MRFKAGDLVEIVDSSIEFKLRCLGLRVGSIGTVVRYCAPRFGFPCVLVDFPGMASMVECDQPCLRKVSDGEDRQTTTWASCVWQPRGVAA
jgi:hypothetical protein